MLRKIAAVLAVAVVISLLVGPLAKFDNSAPAPVSTAGGEMLVTRVNQTAMSGAGNPPVDGVSRIGTGQGAVKSIDQPNIKDKQRMMARQQLLEAGQTAEAAALAQTGTDRVLVVLVEFAGTDVFTWTAPITPSNPATGSQWDPLGIADANEAVYSGSNVVLGDCSKIITQTKTFTYTGPLHNAIERPRSAADRSGDSIWIGDFTNQWFKDFMFGSGVVISYTRQDSSTVNESFLGQSVKQYFSDLSSGTYTITGDVIGWVQVPHSTWYYDADQCPGARSTTVSGVGRGAIPGAGNARTLVRHSLDAVNAISNTIAGFNWANYDLDGDGIIDRLWIVHAGYGEEDATQLLNRNPTVPTDPTRTTPWPAAFYGEAAVWSHSSAVTPPYSVTQNIAAGAYIVMPENGGIGVFAHEYAHNLGADDLYAYGEGETSTGFWALQADDWTGYPIGFEPPAPDPWHLDNWGWLDPKVITDTTQVYTVTLGQASFFNTNTAAGPVYRGAKIVLPTGTVPLPVPVWQGSYYWWGGKLDVSNAMMTTKTPITIPTGVSNLTFDLAYEIEDEWDFLWVEISLDGTTWIPLTNTNTSCVHDSGWIGGLYGFPDDLCGAGLGGFTGHNASWPEPDTEVFTITSPINVGGYLRFWYMTDWATSYAGPFVDDIRVTSGATTQFADDAEAGDAKWNYAAPWIRSNGTMPFTHNFYLQWRNTNSNGGYDSALGDPRWRFGPANTGLLMWYNNNSKTDNEIYSYLEDYPSFGPKGRMLVVDSHPDPYRDPNNLYPNAIANVLSRSQMRDAPFTLQNTVDFTMTAAYVITDTHFAGRPAVKVFNDALGYYPGLEYTLRGPSPCTTYQWYDKMWDASAVVPAKDYYTTKATGGTFTNSGIRMRGSVNPVGLCQASWYGFWYAPFVNTLNSGNPADVNSQYGWHVELLQEGADHTWATVKIWNSAVSKKVGPAPADISTPGVKTFTYTVSLQNASGPSPASGTVTMTLPSGLNFVSASPAGSTLNGNVLNWTNSPLNAGQWVTFTMVATVTVNVGDAPATWTVTYDAVDNSGTTTAMDHGSWTTKASLYALTTAVVGPSTLVGAPGSPVAFNLRLTNTGYNTSTYTVTATTNPSAWTTVIGVGPSAQAANATINVGPLAPQATANLLVFVMVPANVKLGDKAATAVTIASVGDPSKSTTTALLTTTLFKVYLPLVLR